MEMKKYETETRQKDCTERILEPLLEHHTGEGGEMRNICRRCEGTREMQMDNMNEDEKKTKMKGKYTTKQTLQPILQEHTKGE